MAEWQIPKVLNLLLCERAFRSETGDTIIINPLFNYRVRGRAKVTPDNPRVLNVTLFAHLTNGRGIHRFFVRVFDDQSPIPLLTTPAQRYEFSHPLSVAEAAFRIRGLKLTRPSMLKFELYVEYRKLEHPAVELRVVVR